MNGSACVLEAPTAKTVESMHGIIKPSERFIFQLRSDPYPLDDSSESTELSANSSITTRTPLILQRFREQANQSSELKDFDKLNFEALSLYGRDKELDVLNKCLDRLSTGVVARQLILISGDSGTGKTALAQSLETPTAKLNGLFVKGKFDFNNRQDPYSGIVRACVEICDHILSLQEQNLTLFQKVAQLISGGLGSELPLLVKFIPALKGVIDFQDEDANFLVALSSSEEAKNRFRFAFQRFIRIVCDTFAPLVLVLDDLQWSDVSSLDLLDICLSDPRIKKVMIVGTFRSREVDQTHILSEAIARFSTKCDQTELEVTRLSIENLDVQDTNKIIAVMLSVSDDSTTIDLANVCFKKTGGNPFFVIHFLQMVRNSDLLKFSNMLCSWEWNCDEIDSSTSATSNVADLLTAKMASLPKRLLDMLKVAACLGSTFNEKCLRIILENSSSLRSSGEGDNGDFLVSGLQSLEQQGYIVRRNGESSLESSQSFTWTHDMIHEAAVTLVPLKEQATFRRCAGDILLSKLGTVEMESTIFVVANLLNAGELPADDEKRLVIAHLNHDAAMKALSISAFESVADYARKGIKLLPNNHWNDHYELSLGLYSAAAQAEGFLGNADVMEQFCNVVLSQKGRPLGDMMSVYHTLVNRMISKGQVEGASDLLFSILSRCKCRFPKSPVLVRVAVVRNLFKLKSVMRNFDPQVLVKCNDPMVVDLMQLMDKLALSLYVKKDPRVPLVALRILDWTLNRGYTDYSSVGFALTGVLLTGYLGNFRAGSWFGEQALRLVEKSQSPLARCRTMVIVCSLVFIWTRPIAQLLDPLLQLYDEAMHSCDQTIAASYVLAWFTLRFIAGNSLGSVAADIRFFSKQIRDWKVKIQMAVTNCLHQAALNLMDWRSENSIGLLGEVLSEADYTSYSQDDNISPLLVVWEGKLLTYFGDHVRQAKRAIHYGHDYLQKRYPSNPNIASDSLLKGISCFAAAGETGEVKYCKMGEKFRSKMKRWCNMGNPNVIHYESFLDAESAVLQGEKSDAIVSYEITISHAHRFGFIQDAAFASERLAEFHLTAGNEMEAGFHMGQAVGYWTEWGAMGKVEHLEKKYGFLCHGPLSNSTVVIKSSPSSQNEDGVVSFV